MCEKLLSVHSEFLLEFTKTSHQLEQIHKVVNSYIDCVSTENMSYNGNNLEEHIRKLQNICFLLKSFCSEADLNIELLSPEEENEAVSEERIITAKVEIKMTEDTKLPEVQTDDLNKTLPYECYSKLFTYSVIDPSKFKIGCETKFAVTYIKDIVESFFFVMDTTCTDIIFRQPDFRYASVPDEGIIFGILLDGCIVRAVRENQLKMRAKTFRVLLIDFGEILKISKRYEMYVLPENLQRIPGQAIFCKLTKDDNFDNKCSLECFLYTEQTIRIERIVGNMLEVIVNPTEKSTEIETEMFESSYFTGDNTSIYDFNYERPISSPTYLSDVIISGSSQELYMEPVNTENVSEAVMGYDPHIPQVNQRIFKVAKGNTSSKRSSCELEQINISKSSNDKSTVKVLINSEIAIPRIGKKIRLLVSYVVDVETFYGQIIPKNSLENLTVERIANEINDNQMKSKLKRFTMLPDVFELVLAMYTDQLWHRAKILQKSDEFYKVFYVDYGNCDTVTLDHLREWENSFDCYPFQAIECKLDNVTKLQHNDKEATAYFESLVLNKPVVATVTYNVHRLHVKLQDESRFDIGEQLCVLQYAEQKPTTQPVTRPFPG